MKIIIEKVDNGAILEVKGKDSEYNGLKEAYKFETDNDSSKEGLEDLFWQLKEILDGCDGKYSKERISIKRVHGREYKCKEKNCEICKEGGR